jgi:hypothetical protein
MTDRKTPAPTLEERKRLTFEQAEGIAPLPSQLRPGEISQEFRAILWAELVPRLEEWRHSSGGYSYLGGPWSFILRDAHVFRDHKPIDDFSDRYYEAVNPLKSLIIDGQWSRVLG